MPEGGEGDPVPQPEGERKEGRGVWAVPVGFLYGASPWKGKGGCLCTRLAFPRALPRAHPHSLGEKGQGDSEPSFLGLPITPEHFLSQETPPTASPHPPPTLLSPLGRAGALQGHQTYSPTFITPGAGPARAAAWEKGGWALNRLPLSSLCPGRGLCGRLGPTGTSVTLCGLFTLCPASARCPVLPTLTPRERGAQKSWLNSRGLPWARPGCPDSVLT